MTYGTVATFTSSSAGPRRGPVAVGAVVSFRDLRRVAGVDDVASADLISHTK